MQNSFSTQRVLSVEERFIHENAERAAKNFQAAEADLMEALIATEKGKVFLKLGYPSLFRYAVEALKLSEAVAYNAITVSRKAEAVPALREAIHSGELGISKAKKLVSVLERDRSAEENEAWVARAIELPSRQLEKAVAAERPQEAIAEKAVYKSAHRLELVLGVEENSLLDFRRAQDRVSSSRGRAASLEETLDEVLRFYLERKDPEERARRVIAKKGMEQFTGTVAGRKNSVRVPIPTAHLHRVRFRDRGRCQARMPNGKPCGSRRWTEIHHIVPISQGGTHETENLITLCRAHHQAVHFQASSEGSGVGEG